MDGTCGSPVATSDRHIQVLRGSPVIGDIMAMVTAMVNGSGFQVTGRKPINMGTATATILTETN